MLKRDTTRDPDKKPAVDREFYGFLSCPASYTKVFVHAFNEDSNFFFFRLK
jgi:hypothetical protein